MVRGVGKLSGPLNLSGGQQVSKQRAAWHFWFSGRQGPSAFHTGCLFCGCRGDGRGRADRVSEMYLTGCLAISLIAAIWQFVYVASLPYEANWLRPDIVFLPGYFVVHFGFVFCGLAGWLGPSWSRIPTRNVLNYATAVSALGLIAFLIGYNQEKRRRRRPSNELGIQVEPPSIGNG